MVEVRGEEAEGWELAGHRTWNVRTTPRWVDMEVWEKTWREVNPGL